MLQYPMNSTQIWPVPIRCYSVICYSVPSIVYGRYSAWSPRCTVPSSTVNSPLLQATVVSAHSANWTHLAHLRLLQSPLLWIRRPRRMPNRLTLSGHLIQDPPLLAMFVCSHATHVSCHAVSMTGPRACTLHARTTDPHVLVKPRESVLIPNVTFSPGIHGTGSLYRGVVLLA
jgi:hypothetical protein